jgi:quercetin dioxygenase-like cupin family protein
MRVFQLADMKKGWFVGDFVPNVLRKKEFEVAYRTFKAGAFEEKHVHKIATEITVLTSGKATMNGQVLVSGDIMVLEPGEASDFVALEDGAVVVVKTPSVIDDKYTVDH